MVAISLSVVISTVITFACFIAALVAFTPTYITGIDGVQGAVSNLRVNIIRKARSQVQAFLSAPASALSAHAQSYRNGVADLSHASNEAKILLLCETVRSIPAIASALWIEPWVPDTDVYFTLCDTRYGNDKALIAQNKTSLMNTYHRNPTTGLMDLEQPPFSYFILPKLHLRAQAGLGGFISFLHRLGDGVLRWLPAEVGYSTILYRLAFSFKDAYGGNSTFAVDVLPVGVSDILEELALRPKARAFVVDGHSGYIVGNSWNESGVELLPNYRNMSLPTNQRMRLKTLADFGDTLVNDMLAHFGGADEFLNSVPTPYAGTMGSGKDRVFINVENVTDAFGLNMRVVIVMPEIDFMEDTYKSRDMTIGIVVACFVVMVLVAILFSVAITRPIDRIAHRMYLTASLQDDDEDESESILSEVRDMQHAYGTMKAELNRMKSYLPQSVLCAMHDDDDEDIDEGELQTSGKASKNNSRATSPTHSVCSRTLHESASESRSVTTTVRGGETVVVSGGLNTRIGVSNKRVVVVVFNLLNFHSISKSSTTSASTKVQTAFLSLVNRIARDGKGVVDSFQGDHIVVTFNAVNNIACPAKRAAAVALHVVAEAAKDKHLPRVSVGMAQGIALVGNTGCHELQRFNIMGPVYQQAMVLERFAAQKLRLLPKDETAHLILFSEAALPDLTLEFFVQAIDLVELPGGTNPSGKAAAGEAPLPHQQAVSVVYQLSHPKAVADNHAAEWMYELEAGEKADPFQLINDVFAHLAADEFNVADEELKKYTSTVVETVDNASAATTNHHHHHHHHAIIDTLGVSRAKQILSLGNLSPSTAGAVTKLWL